MACQASPLLLLLWRPKRGASYAAWPCTLCTRCAWQEYRYLMKELKQECMLAAVHVLTFCRFRELASHAGRMRDDQGRHGCSTRSASMAIWDATGRYAMKISSDVCARLDWIAVWFTFSRLVSIFSAGVARAMDSPVLGDRCSVMVRSSLQLVSSQASSEG